MASYTQIEKLIEIADNRSVRTVLMSSVSAITLAGCMGGGGGGTFGVLGEDQVQVPDLLWVVN